MLRLDRATDAQIDAAAERYYDRLWDAYWGTDEDDAWDAENPDWTDIADLIDGEGWNQIAGRVRDYIEGNGDILTEMLDAGVLDFAVMPEDEWMRKDPDTAFRLADSILDKAWKSDWLMDVIYVWMPEHHIKAMVERLMDDADENGLREEYNESRRSW